MTAPMSPVNGDYPPGDKPTARVVKDALMRKYRGPLLNGEQWVCIEEARSGAGFAGNDRQCDFLAVNTFHGRGLQVVGHEVKVSLADWKQELAQPEKAEAFARYCTRWWVCVPSDLAAKIKEDVPPAWGLMSLSAKGRWSEVVKAPAREPEPIPPWWWIGWLAQIDRRQTRSVEATVNERLRSEREGIRAEIDAAVAARMSSAEARFSKANENIEQVREITGIDLAHLWSHNLDRLRSAWALVDGRFDPERLAKELRATADTLDACGQLDEEASASAKGASEADRG